MDNETILKQFEDIEQKVEILIDTCKSLETANLQLGNKIKKLEEELQAKVEAESSYQHEKALIRSKIDGLLARLEDVAEAR